MASISPISANQSIVDPTTGRPKSAFVLLINQLLATTSENALTAATAAKTTADSAATAAAAAQTTANAAQATANAAQATANAAQTTANAAQKTANAAAPATRKINTGTGLTGGGDLSADRTISLNAATSNLTDVDESTAPTDGQVLIYNAASGKWKPGAQSGGGGGGTKTAYKNMPFSQLNTQSTTSYTSGYYGGRLLTIEQDIVLSSICIDVVTANAATILTPFIYAVNQSAVVGALLGSGPSVTGVTKGRNELALAGTVTLTAGTRVLFGFVCQGSAFYPAYTTGIDAAYAATSSNSPANPGPTFTLATETWASMYLKGTI